MQYRKLGHSELEVSRIGFGCMSLAPTQDNLQQLVDAAIEGGINFFDTADLYDKGANEEMIGRLLAPKRSKLVLATKVGNQWRADGSGWDWNPRKQYILAAVEDSLRRLQTDYIDLYQLHGGTVQDPMDETIEAFEALKQSGKIRYYGISSIRPNVIRTYVQRSSLTSVMMQYSLLDRRPEESCLPLLQENQVGVLARGTVAGGLLAGKAARPYLAHPEYDVMKAAHCISAISLQNKEGYGTTAIRYALAHPAITAAVVGIRTMDQLREALATGGTGLEQQQWEKASGAMPALKYAEHR